MHRKFLASALIFVLFIVATTTTMPATEAVNTGTSEVVTTSVKPMTTVPTVVNVVVSKPVEITKTEPSASESPTEPVEEKKYYDIPLSRELQDHIFAECKKRNVDPVLIIAMINRETGFKADVIGDNGNSFGLMQIQPRWHQRRMDKLGCDDLLDPFQNVTVGTHFVAELLRYDKPIEWVLMTYNGGGDYAREKMAKGEVSAYAKWVLNYCDKLRAKPLLTASELSSR